MTPRDRALAALDVIDRNSTDGFNNARHRPAVEQAYRDLAAAMNLFYGPLPPPPTDRPNVVRP